MKGFFTALVILLLISCKESGVQIAKPSTFLHYFNGGFNDQAKDIIKTSDGGFLILANTLTKTTLTNSYYKIKLIKTDAYGNEVWERYFPDFGETGYAHSYQGSGLTAIQDNNGGDTGYMIVGSAIHTTNTTSADSLLMIKVEPTKGDPIVTPTVFGLKFKGSVLNAQGVAVAWRKDSSDYFVLAQSSTIAASMIFAKVKDLTSSTLDTVWTKKIGDAGSSILANRLFLDFAGLSLYFGGSAKYSTGGIQTRYVKAGFTSSIVGFNETVGNALSSNFSGNDLCPFGYGYAFIGSQGVIGSTQYNRITYTRLASSGDFMDSTSFKLSFNQTIQPGGSICSTLDGGVLLLGTVAVDAQSTDTNYYLIKIDITGKQQWAKQHGGKFIDIGAKVLATPDGGYILLGTTNLANVQSILLMKTDSQGNIQ